MFGWKNIEYFTTPTVDNDTEYKDNKYVFHGNVDLNFDHNHESDDEEHDHKEYIYNDLKKDYDNSNVDWSQIDTSFNEISGNFIFHGDENLDIHHVHDIRDVNYEPHSHKSFLSGRVTSATNQYRTAVDDRDNALESRDNALETSFANKDGPINLAKQQNEYMRRRFSTKQSQYEYKTGQNRFLNNFIYALLWVYFILAAIYLAIVFVSPKRDQFSYQYKVAVLLILVLYPFIITPIEYFILRGLALIVETVVGNVFERDDYEYVMDYTHLPNFFSY